MCFIFILTENKRYIYFLKKKIKRHTEMVCGIVKGSNDKQIKKKKIKCQTNRFIKEIKQALRALVSEKVHYPFLSPQLLL